MKENINKIIKNFSLSMIIISLFFHLNIVKTQEEDEEILEYILHFDLSEIGVEIPELEDIVSESSSIKIPSIQLDKEDYFFSGWTDNGVYGYEPGDNYVCKSKYTVLKPVFGLLSDKRTFTLEYIVKFEGNIIDITEHLSKEYHSKNRIFATTLMVFPQSTAIQRGWTDGENEFVQGTKMVMPEHNVTLYALYYYFRTLTYSPGDVDGIVGQTYDIQTVRAGGMKDLAEDSRLRRMGYKMVAWHCENDGLDYPFFYQYIMPDEDVIMTAVWEPLIYTVVFNTGVSTIPNIKIQGKTNGIIIAPNLDKREGYIFNGWIIYNNQVYYPGDEIVVLGQMPGLGISAKAIWILS